MLEGPKAFICHASEDKERFVVDFSFKLRERGVDAWLDYWEIQPGDSLIDRIFEKGIKEAKFFVVVLSSNSVDKPWVREELNSAIVRKIEKSCRIIPVILDECKIPGALSHLCWIKIADVEAYEEEFTRIVNAIHGIYEKPKLGLPPKHMSIDVIEYFDCSTRIENLVLSFLCEHYLKIGIKDFCPKEVFENIKSVGFSEQEIIEAIDVLENRGFLSTRRFLSGGIFHIALATSSVDLHLRHKYRDYDQALLSIAAQIVNNDVFSSEEIHKQTRYPLPIVNQMLDLFESKGFLKLVKTLSGSRDIIKVNA